MAKRLTFLCLLVGLGGLWPALAAGQGLPIKLDPPGPPAPTMKTLDEVTPTWNRVLTSDRFELVMDDEAVFDRETGLVWERAPSSAELTWGGAHERCYGLVIAHRMAWRLPSIQELTSLLDPEVPSPSLPAGHPFSGGATSGHAWSATSSEFSESLAWATVIRQPHGSGPNRTETSVLPKSSDLTTWCVRGPSGAGGR